MSDLRFTLTRANGWCRLALPGSLSFMFITPMLWAFGVFGFDDVAFRHALFFGISGMMLFGLIPMFFGWAIQGFFMTDKRSETEDDGDNKVANSRPAPPSSPAPPNRPTPPSSTARR